jgi:hypothetical protein
MPGISINRYVILATSIDNRIVASKHTKNDRYGLSANFKLIYGDTNQEKIKWIIYNENDSFPIYASGLMLSQLVFLNNKNTNVNDTDAINGISGDIWFNILFEIIQEPPNMIKNKTKNNAELTLLSFEVKLLVRKYNEVPDRNTGN